jgi:hypothetical protein
MSMTSMKLPIKIDTFIVIKDLDTGKILREGHNAIHRENMSIAIANGLARNNNSSFISEIHFGRGASVVSDTGTITYRKPNVTGISANLYNTVYFRVVDDEDLNNPDFEFNSTKQVHTTGTDFSDTVITATLDYTEPMINDSVYNIVNGTQQSLDATTSVNGEFVFDEIGLKTRGLTGLNTGNLLTHFIFHPVEKQANQRIQIVYTLRVQAG